MELPLSAAGRHLPYGITQCYLPPHTSEHISPASYFYLFCYLLYIDVLTFMALNGLLCADVPLRNYSLTNHSQRGRYLIYLPRRDGRLS